MAKKDRPQVLKSVEQFEKRYFPNSFREEQLKESSPSQYGSILARECTQHLKGLKTRK